MRVTFARWGVAAGAGLMAMTLQGCRKQTAPAPVQPLVRRVPRVQPDFPVGSLPVEKIDPGVMPRGDQRARRRQQVQPPQVQDSDAEAAAIAEAQRRRDARVLQQQQAASATQQQELNREIEQRSKAQQAVQAEPRIQDSAGPGLPVQPVQPRIQDTLPGPTPAAQPTQPQ